MQKGKEKSKKTKKGKEADLKREIEEAYEIEREEKAKNFDKEIERTIKSA